MPLPSQTGRAGEGGSQSRVYRGRQRLRLPPPPVLLGIGGVVVMLGAGALAFARLGGSSDDTGDEALSVVDPTAAEPTPPSNRAASATAGDPARSSGPLAVGPAADPLRSQDRIAGGTGTRQATPPGSDHASASGSPARIVQGVQPSGTTEATTPASPPQSQPAGRTASGPTNAAMEVVARADRRLGEGDHLAAREILWAQMRAPGMTEDDLAVLRFRLDELHRDIVFSPKIYPNDPFTLVYAVQGGDSAIKIARDQKLGTQWKLIGRVNALADLNRLQPGQQLKLVRGPFHAVVDKSDFRIDIYHGDGNQISGWRYVRSLRVGLGAGDSTPLGLFQVATRAENPAWVNPRNRAERFDANDPRNPIGEHWLGLAGQGEFAVHVGYGLHGTIEPQTIGREASMGCVRLDADDIALVYELLSTKESFVHIVP